MVDPLTEGDECQGLARETACGDKSFIFRIGARLPAFKLISDGNL